MTITGNTFSDAREDLISLISDQYKSLHGVRPRHAYAEMRRMSVAELRSKLDALDAEVVEMLAQERADAAKRDAIRGGAFVGDAAPVNPFEQLR
tara:strand:+ start:7777 stop:8058 length:282 start_codon:yes stop_codon:yes gene_type:complete